MLGTRNRLRQSLLATPRANPAPLLARSPPDVACTELVGRWKSPIVAVPPPFFFPPRLKTLLEHEGKQAAGSSSRALPRWDEATQKQPTPARHAAATSDVSCPKKQDVPL